MMKMMKMMKKTEEQTRIDDYFSTDKTKFFSLLKKTKKWKEIYNQPESKLTFIISITIVIALVVVYYNANFANYISLLNDLIQILIESSVGMLGFIISGLAIFTGTITSKLVKNIDSDKKVDSLIGILFSFYYIGAVIGIGIVVYFFTYIFLHSEYIFRIYKLILVAFICSYLYIYSIFYSISLLGTCLRIFLVSYKYSEDKNENKE